jgi:hypothetical protein
MIDLENCTRQLNELIMNGKTLQAMELFYDEDVQMQENEETPTIGKEKCMAKELSNIERTKQVVCKLLKQAIDKKNEVVFSEWQITFCNEQNNTLRVTEVSVQQWKNEKVVHEKFYYKDFYPALA